LNKKTIIIKVIKFFTMSLLIGLIALIVVLYVFIKHSKGRQTSTGNGAASNIIVVDRTDDLDTDNRRPTDVGDDKSPVDWDNDSRHQL
jgi:uncharacterized protein (UPF0333 family)